MKEVEHERRDWMIVAIILLFGLLCVLLSGYWALRFSPSWRLDADMGSNLNPNGDYLTRPSGFVPALDSDILTQPAWFDIFLTPGAAIPTRIRLTSTPIPLSTSTSVSPIPTEFPTGTATNTLIYIPPAYTATSYPTNTKTPKPKPASTATSTSISPTDTPITPTLSADLQITKTDNTPYYEASGSMTYTIVVSNNGPDEVNSATVIDNFPSQVSSATWDCTATGTTCNTAKGSGNINDTVNLPAGSSITYSVVASIGTASGDMTNTATVSSSVADPVPSNNSATDTDQLAFSLPYGNIGTIPDGSSQKIQKGSYLILKVSTFTINSSSYLVYYPDYPNPPAASTLQMDVVGLEIGDGNNWYSVFNWGDGLSSNNGDIPSSPSCTGEPDICPIDISSLAVKSPYPGVTINLGSIPVGTSISYIRILSPAAPPDSGNGVNIDAIQVFP